jgi:hypothetical protein
MRILVILIVLILGIRIYTQREIKKVEEATKVVKAATNILEAVSASMDEMILEGMDFYAPPSRLQIREMMSIESEIAAYKRKHGRYPTPESWKEQLSKRTDEGAAQKYIEHLSVQRYTKYNYKLENGEAKVSFNGRERTIELNEELKQAYRNQMKSAYGAYIVQTLSPKHILTIRIMNNLIMELWQYLKFCRSMPSEQIGSDTFDLFFLEKHCEAGYKFRIKNPVLDSWGNPIRIRFQNRIPIVVSYGKDGKPGGTNDDQDFERSAAVHDPRWNQWLARSAQ